MRVTNRRRRPWFLALVPLTLLALPVGGCIILAEEVCFEGNDLCSEDFVVQCLNDEWVILEDCDDTCAGTCAYVNSDPVCVCPPSQP
ncbi:hypothetical protein [Polyangium sp. y55x31]|uniref:hypothetical protein n=1 Tax=Polyangium sp. y55x31 TaxID=3042688 RepID=UPI002482165D|nr:hypothetical protein [Polyangium sp. y55x31]MDI1476458.1 hypothetical protein [Polyangium sp. y55x31]